MTNYTTSCSVCGHIHSKSGTAVYGRGVCGDCGYCIRRPAQGAALSTIREWDKRMATLRELRAGR